MDRSSLDFFTHVEYGTPADCAAAMSLRYCLAWGESSFVTLSLKVDIPVCLNDEYPALPEGGFIGTDGRAGGVAFAAGFAAGFDSASALVVFESDPNAMNA